MAEVVLRIRDKDAGEKGDVECIGTPSFADLAERVRKNHPLTNAETFALVAYQAMRETSKKNKKKDSIIYLPTFKGLQ